MQEQLFVVGAPGFQGDVQFALKVVGSRAGAVPIGSRRTLTTGGSPVPIGTRRAPTVGFCTQVQTPMGDVLLAPFVPSSYPENWLNMLAYDRCTAPDEFPYRQANPCNCGCAPQQQCSASCSNAQAQVGGMTPPPGYTGYLGEHHPRQIAPVMAAGYQSRPSCSGPRVPPPQPARAAVVGGCPGYFASAAPLPLQMVPGYPVPKRLVSVPRYAGVPAATDCGCDVAATPEAAGAVTPPAAFFLYNPFGTINGRRK